MRTRGEHGARRAWRAAIALLRDVSLRQLRTAPWRTLLTVLGVALGVAGVVAMSSVDGAIFAAFRELADRAGGKADLEVLGDESGVPQSLVDELVARSDVAHASAVLERTTRIGSARVTLGAGARALVVGVDVLGDLALVPFERPGGAPLVADPLAFVNDPEAILVTDTLADALGVGVGDPVRLRAGDGVRTFHVEALLHERGEAKMFGGLVAVLSLDAAQEAFGARERVDRIDVQLARGVDASRAEQELSTLLAGRAEVAAPIRRGEQSARMLRSVRVGLDLSAAIAVLVGMLLVFDAISVAVARRRRELATLRMVGATRGQLLAAVLGEALAIALVGAMVGVVAGALLARAVLAEVAPTVSRTFEPIVAPHPELTVRRVLFAIGLGVGVTLLAAFVPAWRASRTPPVEALRRTALRAGLPSVRLAVGGLCLVALARPLAERLLPGHVATSSVAPGLVDLVAIALGAACAMPLALTLLHRGFVAGVGLRLGVGVRLGVDNVARALGRSAITGAALLLAMATSVAIGSFARSLRGAVDEWLAQTTVADVLVTAGAPLLNRQSIAFTPEVEARLAAPPLPGVAALDAVRVVRVRWNGVRILLQGSDTRLALGPARRGAFRRVLEGAALTDPNELHDQRALVVSENLARAFELHPGSAFELDTPHGRRTFRVRAVVVDYSSALGWALVDRRWLLDDWGDARVDRFELSAHADGAAATAPELAALRAEVERRLSTSTDDALFVTTAAAAQDEVRASVSRAFALTGASQVIAFVVAVLGVIGAMFTAVVDHARELGVLRALGASRGQVVVVVLAEAVFLGVASALVGAFASVPLSWQLTKIVGLAATGWDLPFRYPWLVAAELAVAVILAAAAAAVVPARRASRRLVTDALASD